VSTNNPDQMNELVARIVDVFERADIPRRPSNEETIETIAQNSGRRGVRRIPLHRKSIMKILTPLAALAAGIVLTISLWPLSQSIVFAQVLEQIRKADVVKFGFTLQRPGFPDISGNAYAKSPDLLRYEFKSNGHTTVNITNYSKGELISFDSAATAATVWMIPREAADIDVVRRLRQMKADGAKRVVEEDAESDPNIDVFEVSEGNVVGKIWVDKQTKLPVRIEMHASPESGLGGAVYNNFDWDPTIADSTFEIPAGFRVTKNNLLAEPTEGELVAALRVRQAFSQEPYSADFLAKHAGAAIGHLAYDQSLSREKNHQRQLKVLGPILREIGVNETEAQDAKSLGERIDYLCMKVDQWATIISGKNGAWTGAGVRPGEDKPLCWWRTPGVKNVRVLYGNLTIHDADQPPASK
jgi:outer membrane lipoprotein-sorting protein